MFSVFKNNRRNVQNAFFREDNNFWKVLRTGDETITITETSPTSKLKQVVIDNVPVSTDIDWTFLIDLENKIPVLSKIEYTKTTEKALVIKTDTRIYVFMFELKSGLKAEDDNDISGI